MIDVKVIATGSTGNCYLVTDGSSKILLDAGVPIKRISKGCDFALYEVAGCLVTHSHDDHCHAVKDLVRAGISVYMTAGEIQAMRTTGIHLLQGSESRYERVRVGSFDVLPFHIEHDTPEPVGFFLQSFVTGERLVYFTDTYYIKNRFAPFDYLIGEVNYDDETLWQKINENNEVAVQVKRVLHSHMSLKNFLGFLEANDLSRLKKIWICHMSNGHANEKLIKEAVQRATGVEVYVC